MGIITYNIGIIAYNMGIIIDKYATGALQKSL